MKRSTLINGLGRTLRNLLAGIALLTAVAAPVAESQAHSVQVAYCANCASTLRIFFEHWHGCTVNPQTSGTITISITVGATTTTTTGFPTLNLCNVPFSALPGCNTPPTFVASCPASANAYNDWWAFDFNNVPCGVPISIVASNPSNVYVADCGGMFPVSFSLTIPCNVNKPFANFSVSADTVCLGQAISFTDLSTGGNPGLTYQWDFNDGSPLSTVQNPTHTYAAPGTYCVRLDVAKQSGGCLDDTTICVTVLGTPVINIGNPTICAGQTATLTANAAPGGGTYNWTPGGMTTQTINVSPGATTTYTVNYVSPGGCAGSQTATVTVNPNPTVNVSNATICAGQSGTITATPSIGGGTYAWTPGGMTTQSITASPGATTTYTVTYTDPNGCTGTGTGTITVNPNPTVNVNNVAICAGQNGALTATPSIGGGTYSWAPGGATTQTINPAPGTTTTYTVTYTDPNGCTGTGSGTITVNPNPTVNVTGGATVCAGQPVTLTANASPGVTYSWAPGGATTQTITVTPGATTTYTVTVTTAAGCTATANGTVTINPQPTVTLLPASICLGQSTTLTPNVNPPGAWSYSWTPGGATTPTLTVSPATTTNYTVIISGAGGCADTATATVTVTANPTVNIINDTICVGQTGNLTALPSVGGGTYLWNPGGMTTQAISASPGATTTYSVTYNMSGCTGTGSGTIVVRPQPTVNATNATICAGQNATITATPSIGGGTYAWTPGGMTTQSITVSPGATTTYTVTYDLNGCTATANGTVTVNPQPTVTVNNASICAGQVATLTANATPGGVTYAWVPGGATTAAINVSPAATTTYTVTVTAPGGCTDTASGTVTVITNPTANFNAANVCDGVAMQFNNTSVPTTGTWTWNFGDGNTSTQTNPTHTYAGPGTYNVKLVITAGSGCADSVTIPVTVDPLPVPAFNTTPACPGFGTQFTDGTTVGTGTITGWSWDFGDGNSSTQQNPAHPYAAGGTYTVKLIATSSTGCVDSITQTITVPYKPIAQFTHDTVCLGVPTSFTDQSNVNGGTITGWNWAFGDGNTSTQQNPQNTYATAGTFTTTLIVTSNDGCLDTVTSVVTVISNPVAAFTAPNVCDLLSMQFTDGSLPTPNTWLWNFGDGNTSTQQNPGHTYAGPGNYNVKLVITAGSGCTDSVTQAVTVHPLPAPGFTFTDDCANQAINFTNTSTIPTGNINGWLWKFGNGATSTQQNPTYTYTNPGSYTVTLIATSDNGCVDSIQQVINIFALPVTDFTFDTVCLNDQTCFIDLTTVQGSNITGWQWVFGDGSPVNNQSNPCHTYATAGTFNVTLITTSAQGCTGTASHTILVNDNPAANFSVNNVCQIDAAQFNDLSTIGAGVINNWQWDFGDGSPQSNQQNPSHNYGIAGTYTVQLVTFAGTGCSDTVTQNVVVHPMPVANFNFTNVCDGLQLPLIDNSNVSAGAITGWNWSFGDGSPNGANQNENHIYPNFGSWNVQLIVTTDSGCTDTISKTVDVYPNPVVDFSPTSVCEGTPTQFMDGTTVPNNGNAQSWIWNFGDGTPNQSGQNPTHTYAQWGTYQTKLIVSTNNGCVDSLTKPVNVNAVPVSEFVADVVDGCEPVCPNFTDQSTIANGNIVTYAWDFGDGNNSSLQNPSHCYPNAGTSVLTYNVTLTVTSDSGCVHTITKPAYINVYPYPVADFNPDPDVVKISAADITFNNYSVGNAQNSWDFGDGVGTSNGVSPTYTYQDTGNFIVWLYIENQWGCRDSTWREVRVDPEFFIYIPNAFTPGDDGINDRWSAEVYGVDEMSTLIFDRWGELIWEGHQIDSKWDGMVKGTRAETETYVYLIKLVTFNGENKEYRGKVTLLK